MPAPPQRPAEETQSVIRCPQPRFGAVPTKSPPPSFWCACLHRLFARPAISGEGWVDAAGPGRLALNPVVLITLGAARGKLARRRDEHEVFPFL